MANVQPLCPSALKRTRPRIHVNVIVIASWPLVAVCELHPDGNWMCNILIIQYHMPLRDARETEETAHAM